ncbi:hypothetical protein TEA_014358 [Camellia sinensis var. sinensis]|uniref:Uncharacterized protein n=1 Tax=Camellia sinensis var. sinensis TaxID=542762 RepID=A0A4S4DT18_CAMSN|nr:hypothetical protein TEA_014358 [Camellia sinensis var. sinensis]
MFGDAPRSLHFSGKKNLFTSYSVLMVEDLCVEGIKKCYFLDFLGPRGFAAELSWRTSCEVIGFDHRKSILSKISSDHDCSGNLTFHVDIEKSSSTAVYEYFSAKLSEMKYGDGNAKSLLNPKDRDCMELVLKYIEDADLRRWILPNIKAFNIRLGKWHSMLNCITNPHMYEQLLEISSADLIGMGISYISTQQDAVKKLLDKGVRADGNSNLSDEIGKELSIKSAAAGLRPIGAVVYMQRNNLKVCLRSTDTATDTSEVAKGNAKSLLNPKDRDCMVLVLKYIEDADLRRWILPNIKAFNIRLGEWHSMLNCITNPHMYEQVQCFKF